MSINGPKSINITWLSPLAEDINGLIRHFTINITGHYKNRSILTSEHLYHSVQGLIPFINYSISVAAITVDTGPFSDLVTVEMPEAGKLSHFLTAQYWDCINKLIPNTCILLHA